LVAGLLLPGLPTVTQRTALAFLQGPAIISGTATVFKGWDTLSHGAEQAVQLEHALRSPRDVAPRQRPPKDATRQG